jgi:hypothetical protein
VTAAARLSSSLLLLGGALGAGLAVLGVAVVVVGPPHDALADTPANAIALFRHNLPIDLWPLALVWLGWPAIPVARSVGDALVTGQLVWHGALLGSALAQQPALWRYLPHLPFEYTALALPTAAWWHARRTAKPAATTMLTLTLTVIGLLAAAAILETYLVPA